MEHITISKEQFSFMQKWSLEDADILDKRLIHYIALLHKNDTPIDQFDSSITDFIFGNFDEVVLIDDAIVAGIINGREYPLFDVKGRKVSQDLSMSS